MSGCARGGRTKRAWAKRGQAARKVEKRRRNLLSISCSLLSSRLLYSPSSCLTCLGRLVVEFSQCFADNHAATTTFLSHPVILCLHAVRTSTLKNLNCKILRNNLGRRTKNLRVAIGCNFSIRFDTAEHSRTSPDINTTICQIHENDAKRNWDEWIVKSEMRWW